MPSYHQPALSRAVSDYLLSLPTDRRAAAWSELSAFARWYGGERPAGELTPEGVREYLRQLDPGGDARRLEPLRAFFTYLEKVSLVREPVAAALEVTDTAGRDPLPPASAPDPTGSARDETGHCCSGCGEEEALRGRRGPDHIAISCERCGHTWRRSLRRACPRCGGTDLVPTREELREKVRGTQVAVIGIQTVYRCPACDA